MSVRLFMQELRKHADDPAFQAEWQAAKKAAKVRAVDMIQRLCGECVCVCTRVLCF